MSRAESVTYRVTAIFAAALLSFWGLDRRIPVEQISNIARPPTVAAGDDLNVASDVVRHRLCRTRLTTRIYDGRQIRYILAEREIEPGPGDPARFAQRIPIPAQAAAGPAHVAFTLSWWCNPLQSALNWPVTLTIDVPFTIIKEPAR